MCTVLLRFAPGARWPILLAAVRDEFVARAWDPPGTHWDHPYDGLVGGRDHAAGGTWLAVDPDPQRPALAALLNGVRRPVPSTGPRPTRGTLALDALATGRVPTPGSVTDHDGFHLVVADLGRVEVWSWDGETLVHRELGHGDHIVVNLGVDAPDDPLVPHFAPLLDGLPDPLLHAGAAPRTAWEPWCELLQGDSLDPDDPRALLVRRNVDGLTYGSTSASLVGLSPDGIRYDFTADPWDPDAWYEVAVPSTPVQQPRAGGGTR